MLMESVPHPAILTAAGFGEEAASAAELDRRLTEVGLFKVYSEVCGCYVQPRYGADLQTPRIDRILVPGQKIVDAGWTLGIVGIECKGSGIKIGKVVSQCIDYTRAAFTLPRSRFTVMCSWVFIWPLDNYGGDTASIMDQNRIGGAIGTKWSLLRLKTACVNALDVRADGTFTIGEVRQGNKTGSR